MCIDKVYIFNPETDMALGSGCHNYTPPINVQGFIRRLALLPALYAMPGSMILLPVNMTNLRTSDTIYYPDAMRKDIRFVKDEDLRCRSVEVIPWGWDETLCRRLERIQQFSTVGCDIRSICHHRRRLSHRKLTIDIHTRLNMLLSKDDISLPMEFNNVAEAKDWANTHIGCYLKSPWSSSGKGIFRVTNQNTHLLESWLTGVINKQGSVMAEIGEIRSLDFATEWMSYEGEVTFVGYSVFEVNERGGYLGNLLKSTDELEQMICRVSPSYGSKYIEALRQVLTETIAPHYNGPFGVDMLATTDGRINPCVEVNLRMTMGHVAIELYKQGVVNEVFRPGEKVWFK